MVISLTPVKMEAKVSTTLKKNRAMLDFTEQHLLVRRKNFAQLDEKDERILNAVALAYVRKDRLSVKDLMTQRVLGSPATIHARIKFLRSKDLIEYKSTEDARRYQIVPSEKLLRYFDELGLAIKKIAGTSDK